MLWLMALVESSGPVKHTKVSSEDVRLKKSEVIVLDVLMKNEATSIGMLDIMKAFNHFIPCGEGGGGVGLVRDLTCCCGSNPHPSPPSPQDGEVEY